MTPQEIAIVAVVCLAVIFATKLTVKVAKGVLLGVLVALAYYGITRLGVPV